MLRRTPARPALLAALILALAPAAGRGSEIDSSTVFRLTNGTNNPLDYVFLGFTPNNAIVEPTGGAPLKILGGSSGFDNAQQRGVLIANLQDSSGSLHQALGVDFVDPTFGVLTGNAPPTNVSSPLGVGQSIDFTLNLDPTLADSFAWSLTDSAFSQGLTLTTLPSSGDPGTPVSGGDPGPTVNTPEPLPLLFWSAATMLGLARAHVYRRSRKAA